MGLYGVAYSGLVSRLDPELSHNVALRLLQLGGSSRLLRRLLKAMFSFEDRRLSVAALGLVFPNPLGSAAGLDKNGVALPGIASLGFGFIEVGTVTPLPQPGNPRPRLFRLPEDRAVINRMGFPNIGAERLAQNLRKRKAPMGIPLGVSIGKGAGTPIEQAVEDYLSCLASHYEHADYFAINVSSPNTPELRSLQDKRLFERLVRALIDSGTELAREKGCPPKPLLAKVSPDLDIRQLEDVLEVAVNCGLAGIIATNTTLARPGLASRRRGETGGLSGSPLREASTQMVREIYKRVGGKLVIVGSGGIFSAEDAWEKLIAGATLLQAYTGFIYEGPGFARKVSRGLLRLMEKSGVMTIAEVVGKA
ncbi:MAG: quinone-dependent dihydroorotate dehydrogenase [Chloroflexota bacterium]|nr:quinone-dependent dihydroorotate dehydrogenase [Chloroflexota bacterium]